MLSMHFQLFLLMLRRRTDMASARKALKDKRATTTCESQRSRTIPAEVPEYGQLSADRLHRGRTSLSP